MILRSLFVSVLAAGVLISGHTSAQVLLCPEPPQLGASLTETEAEVSSLLERLMIALDLYGHDGIDIEAIVDAHTETPGALLAKLGNVADRCAFADNGDLKGFYDQLPDLRRAFLEATLIGSIADSKDNPAFVNLVDAVQLERSADLSVRALWRKLWFRSPSSDSDQENRWAVIVASPSGADRGWDMLGEFQKSWKDVYFQLHQPYYNDSS